MSYHEIYFKEKTIWVKILESDIIYFLKNLFTNDYYTERPNIRNEEGPKVLAPPPTAHMAQPIFSLGVAVGTLDKFEWRLHGDF